MNITRKLHLLFRLTGTYPEYLEQVHTLTSQIHFRNILGHFVSCVISSPPDIPTYSSFSIFPISGTCPVNLMFDLVILRTRGEESRFRSSTVCSILHVPVTLFPLPPYILPSTLYPNTVNMLFH